MADHAVRGAAGEDDAAERDRVGPGVVGLVVGLLERGPERAQPADGQAGPVQRLVSHVAVAVDEEVVGAGWRRS
jgi:hypothetical protein